MAPRDRRDRLGARAGVLLAIAGTPFLTLASCGTPSQAPDREIAYFAESDSAYAIGDLIARLDTDDERVMFGSVTALVQNDSGYIAADGLNQRLVLLDRNLNVVRMVGRHGEGPGEYQFPMALVRDQDEIAVLDASFGRVTYLTSRGDFVRTHPLGGFIRDLAIHPEFGLLVAGDAFPDHYLGHVTETGQTPFAAIPPEFRAEPEASLLLRTNLVAVTPDNRTHVLDGRHLALASYDGAGHLARLAYLPEGMRTRLLEEDAKEIDALGGPARVMGSELATELHALKDGRLFLRITYLDAIGFVLDPRSLHAIPVTIPDVGQWGWMRSSGASFFDGKRLVMEGLEGPAALVIVETELVAR